MTYAQMDPLMQRIAIGKLSGLIFGLACVLAMPLVAPEAGPMLRSGILLWYTTLGAIIGVFGVVTYHPVLRLPMPWYVRAPVLGAWMNFVLVLIAHEPLTAVMASSFGPAGLFASPFWIVAEGAVAGLLIGFVTTRIAGEAMIGAEVAGSQAP